MVTGRGRAVRPCRMAGACRKRRRHGRGALRAALLAWIHPSAWRGAYYTRIEWPVCCAALRCADPAPAAAGWMHGGGPSILYVTVRALAALPCVGSARVRLHVEPSVSQGRQSDVNAAQQQLARNVPPTWHLHCASSRWRQINERNLWQTAPLWVLKMGDGWTNSSTVCVNFWTSKKKLKGTKTAHYWRLTIRQQLLHCWPDWRVFRAAASIVGNHLRVSQTTEHLRPVKCSSSAFTTASGEDVRPAFSSHGQIRFLVTLCVPAVCRARSKNLPQE